MPEFDDTLKISAPISPYSPNDTYPTHLSIYGKGGIKSVSTLFDRDLIPEERREEGMLCYVASNNKIYVLRGGISNEDWVNLASLVEVDGAGSIAVGPIAPEDPTAGTVWFNSDDGNIYTRDPENTRWVQYVPPLVDGGEF